jgi:hypothetical protein
MVSTVTPLRKSQRHSQEIDSSVARPLALSGLPVYVASSRLGSILLLFVQDVFWALSDSLARLLDANRTRLWPDIGERSGPEPR